MSTYEVTDSSCAAVFPRKRPDRSADGANLRGAHRPMGGESSGMTYLIGRFLP